MNNTDLKIKLSFISGLRRIVLHEISSHPHLHVSMEDTESLYIDFIQDLTDIKNLKSVERVYITTQNDKYNPSYISNHKLILGNLIKIVLKNNKKLFKSFKITCAGSDSSQVNNIAEYVQKTYDLKRKNEADLKIHIIKIDGTWEVGVQITPRPLSLREYKLENMSGAINPTIAFAMNSLCKLEKAQSYLNIFSGSATLLIEATQFYSTIKQFVGFDNNKKHISLAIQNIKKAGLLKKIQLKEKDILNENDLGTFDVITSDLPFGMVISKNENLENLYQHFIDYCQEALNPQGQLVIYTSKYEMLEEIIVKSKFNIQKTIDLTYNTSIDATLHTRIFVCKFK